MVARQRWFEATVGASRHRNALRKPRIDPRAVLAERLASYGGRLLCIHGEANSWPHTVPDGRSPSSCTGWRIDPRRTRPFES
jgi:hypothetical protein